MILAILFPNIDPVAVHLGPLAIRWYALAYVVGLLIGWRYCLRLCVLSPHKITREQIDDFLFWAIIGVILGGRTGYVLFYNLPFYSEHPLEIFAVWRGGMSFHGGFLGVLVAVAAFTRNRKIPFVALSDIVAAAAPIGLFFGRIANFINAEMVGRVSDVPWAMVFPGAGNSPRHPSQLYEAALEGVVLFTILCVATYRYKALTRPGTVFGLFLIFYGLFRSFVEFFREPHAGHPLDIGIFTPGIVYSIPMILIGLWLIWRARAKPALAP